MTTSRQSPFRVLLAVNAVRPGGGPPGYVYSLLKGNESLSTSPRVEYLTAQQSRDIRTPDPGVPDQSTMRARRAIKRAVDGATRGHARRTASQLRYFASSERKRWRTLLAGADIAVIHGYQASPETQALMRSSLPVVYMPHSPAITAHEQYSVNADGGVFLPAWKVREMRTHEAALIDRSCALVFPSEGAAGEYRAEFSDLIANRPVHYVESGVHRHGSEQPPQERRRQRPQVLFAGRYAHQKGYDLYCEAATILTASGVDADFISIGTGPLRPTPDVCSHGWTLNPQHYINEADLIVIPNRVAYYDLLPLECAALGKPMIFTPVGGNIDQARDLPDSLLSESATASDIAHAIRTGLASLCADQTWGSRNQIAFRAKFTAEAMAARWQSVLQQVTCGD